MGWKILTAIAEIEGAKAQTLATTQQQVAVLQYARAIATSTTQALQTAEGLKFVNVQRLLMAERFLSLINIMPLITPPEALRRISAITMPLLEEEEKVRRQQLLQRQVEQERIFRRQTTRLEKHLQEVRERLLSPTAISLTDHQAFCLLEKHLWQNYPIQTQQVMQELLMMTVAKQAYITRIRGLEALQKQMLQLYVTMFMGVPEMTNMLALRLSQLTMQMLATMNVAIYMQASHQAQAMKQKQQLISAQERKLITKSIASAKPRKEWVPRKEELDTVDELSKDEMIEIMKDLQGKAMFSIMMRYAYGMPYMLRRWLARTYGLPENHKYIRYIKLTGIPLRKALWAYKRKRHTDESWLRFNRDQYIKLMNKYGSRFRAGY